MSAGRKILTGSARKAKGARRERQARDILITKGYLVTKAGGSLGAFDLVAIGPDDDRLVQVKSNRPPGRQEMAILKDLAAKFTRAWRKIELWIFRDGSKVPEVRVL